MTQKDNKKIVRYWRNSFADGLIEGIDFKKSDYFYMCTQHDLIQGFLDKEIVAAFKAAYINLGIQKDRLYPIPVIIAPYLINKKKQGIGADSLTPILFSALLYESGELRIADKNQKPWVSRCAMRPVHLDFKKPTIADVDDYSRFFDERIDCDNENHLSCWKKFFNYALNLLPGVSSTWRQIYKDLNYQVDDHAVIFINHAPRDNNLAYLVEFYDELLKSHQFEQYQLLNNIASLQRSEIKQNQSEFFLIQQAVNHLGHVYKDKPLAPSHREAIASFVSMQEGEVLAIITPPGTDKKSVLRGIIANQWVGSVLNKNKTPPIMLGIGNNDESLNFLHNCFNQLFDSTQSNPVYYEGRWINELESLSLRCFSTLNNKNKSRPTDKFYYVFGSALNPKSNPEHNSDWLELVETETFIYDAKYYFLNRYNHCFSENVVDLDKAKHGIYDRLSKVYDSQLKTLTLVQRVIELNKEIKQLIRNESIYDKSRYILRRAGKFSSQIVELEKFHNQWKKYLENESKLFNLFNFIKPLKQKIIQKDKVFFMKHYQIIPQEYDRETFSNDMQNKVNRLKQDLVKIKSSYETLQVKYASLIKLKRQVKNLLREHVNFIQMNLPHYYNDNSYIDINQIADVFSDESQSFKGGGISLFDHLDIHFRYMAFNLATHYWECDWLIEMHHIISNEKLGDDHTKRDHSSITNKLSRLSKLTPFFISNLEDAPLLFSYEAPLSKKNKNERVLLHTYVDLLIFNEAERISPEESSLALALGKKSIIFGDIKQHNPIHKISPLADFGNLSRQRIVNQLDKKQYQLFSNIGITASRGSLMKLAQKSCQYKNTNNKMVKDKGIYLLENEGSNPGIVAFNSRTFYHNQIISDNNTQFKQLFPPLCYTHVRGQAKKIKGDFINRLEADQLLYWLTINQQKIEAFYQQNLSELAGIITPYRHQQYYLKTQVNQLDLGDIHVGTPYSFSHNKKIILFSATYDEKNRQHYYDDKATLINFSTSKAIDSFILFADMSVFDSSKKYALDRLAAYLFEKRQNEIRACLYDGITIEQQFVHKLLLKKEDYAGLFKYLLKNCKKELVLASPYLNINILFDNNIIERLQKLLSLRVKISLYFSSNRSFGPELSRSDRVKKERLIKQGINLIDTRTHLKVLIVDEIIYSEGFFSWLSDWEAVKSNDIQSIIYFGKNKITKEKVKHLKTNTIIALNKQSS